MIQLRNYQQRGVDQIRDAYRDGCRAPLYQLSTGGGKSVIFTYITKNAAAKGTRVWIVVHRQELVRQVRRHLADQNVPHGVIAAGHNESPAQLVQVCSVQSLPKRIERLAEPGLIVLDECHHVRASTWANTINRFPKAKLLGVSATPQRTSGHGLGAQCGGFFDRLILGPEMETLIAEGFLAPPIYYAPPVGIDVSNVHTLGGDFNNKELELAVDTPTITGNIVAHYTRLCPGKPAIAFCVSVKHAQAVADEFKRAGYLSEMIDGKLDDKIRAERIASLGDGRLHVLASCDLVSEGVDIPVVVAGLMCRPTASLTLWLQQCGRILRPSPGKQNAIIADHAGNCLRHGLAEEHREWTLDGSNARKKAPTENPFPNRQCPSCYRVHAYALSCPQCGHIYETKERKIEQVDGTLTQITAEDIARSRAKQQVGMANSRPALMAIARQRGYKPAWVDMMLRAKMRKKLSAQDNGQGVIAI